MSTIVVKRPRERAEILRLIRERTRHIAQLEQALTGSLPQQDRKHLRQRLHGERMNRQSWIDYLAKQDKQKGKAA
jgi:hypothetical protein